MTEISTSHELGMPPISGVKPLVIVEEMKTPRGEAMYGEVYSAIHELSKRGVNFFQISASDYFGGLTELRSSSNFEKIQTWNSERAIVCQLGDDRSKREKLLMIDMQAPSALTTKDKTKLSQRTLVNPYPRVGMSFNALGIHIDEGEVEGKTLTPDGFEGPINTISGFVDSVEDLHDLELLSKWVNHFCKNNNLDKLDLNIVVIEGKGTKVEEEVDKLRESLKIEPTYRTS